MQTLVRLLNFLSGRKVLTVIAQTIKVKWLTLDHVSVIFSHVSRVAAEDLLFEF